MDVEIAYKRGQYVLQSVIDSAMDVFVQDQFECYQHCGSELLQHTVRSKWSDCKMASVAASQ